MITKMSHSGLKGDSPRVRIQSSRMENMQPLLPNTRPGIKATITGTGTGLESADCLLPSFGEALERYCIRVFNKAQFKVASAEELGSEALDLDCIPKCSETELRHPKCQLQVPDRKARIRWVRGLSLFDGRLVYLPVVMVYLYAGFMSPAERFWFPISTGCAAHTSFERALVLAILEIIERDAISILWLQKLSLPLLEVDHVPANLMPFWERYQASSEELEYFFFNATTDLGVPVIYGVQRARADENLTTLVSCSAAPDPVEALIKVMRDMAACRIASRMPKDIPESWDDFASIFHGARYMAQAEQAHAFDFLLQSGKKQALSEIPSCPMGRQGEDRDALRSVVELLRRHKLEAYAVDLTTDEALRSGVRVVRVVIPGLQPVGFQYRSRYLGHPRLYQAPGKMGYKVHTEEELNPWPQPFA